MESKIEEIVDNKKTESSDMTNEFYKKEISENLGNVPIMEPKSQIDAKSYKGFKIKIANVRQFEVIDYYTGPKNEQGMPTFNSESKIKKRIVEVETESLPEIDERGNAIEGKLVQISDIDGKTRPLVVSAKFNLKKEVDKVTGNIVWGISKAPRAKLWAFMRKQGARTLDELKGTIVVLDAVPDADENSDRFWLRISN